jgi:effector-binding domain-containing protein
MSRLSIKALRWYDECGLLAPAWVDPASGYRYYRASQVNRAEAIRILRLIDLPLDEIGQILAEDDPELTAKRLVMQRERLEEQLADRQRMLRFLERLINRGGSIMPYDVTIKKVEAQPVASVTHHTDLAAISDHIGQAFATLMGAMSQAGTSPAGAPFIVFHDVIDEKTDGDIEVCIPVPADAQGSTEGVAWKETPATAVVSTTHQGPYDEISPAYHTVTGWIQDHGHEVSGPPREIYLNDPQTVAPEDLLTEVQFPIHDADQG